MYVKSQRKEKNMYVRSQGSEKNIDVRFQGEEKMMQGRQRKKYIGKILGWRKKDLRNSQGVLAINIFR